MQICLFKADRRPHNTNGRLHGRSGSARGCARLALNPLQAGTAPQTRPRHGRRRRCGCGEPPAPANVCHGLAQHQLAGAWRASCSAGSRRGPAQKRCNASASGFRRRARGCWQSRQDTGRSRHPTQVVCHGDPCARTGRKRTVKPLFFQAQRGRLMPLQETAATAQATPLAAPRPSSGRSCRSRRRARCCQAAARTPAPPARAPTPCCPPAPAPASAI